MNLREAMIEVLRAAEGTLPKGLRAYVPIRNKKHEKLVRACQYVSQYIEHGKFPDEDKTTGDPGGDREGET